MKKLDDLIQEYGFCNVAISALLIPFIFGYGLWITIKDRVQGNPNAFDLRNLWERHDDHDNG